MKNEVKTNKKVEEGLIIRKNNIFSKFKRLWNIIFFKEEANFFQKFEKYVIKNRKIKKEIIVPQNMNLKKINRIEEEKNVIYIASGNLGKIKEVKSILEGFKIITIKEAGIEVDVEEDQDTFAKNATKKATTISKILNGKICLADDSGIEIEYLKGFPRSIYKKVAFWNR